MAGNHGVIFEYSGNENLVLHQIGASAAVLAADDTFTGSTGNNYLAAVSHSKSLNTAYFWTNSSTARTKALTFNTSTTDASGVASIGKRTGGANTFVNSVRLYGIYGFNAILSDAEMALVYAALEARHGRDYTP